MNDIIGVDNQGNLVAKPEVPRLKRYIYRHAHKCSQEGEYFTYRPTTQGPVMFPIHPVCVEAESQLLLCRIEDDV